jgi:3-hydroxyisobutyrate dehydrogenase-like beta-hydroxyacid dehydrogenase
MDLLEPLGFIGLGNMGGPIALRLVRAGYRMTVLDLDEKKMAPLVTEGAVPAKTAAGVARSSSVVFTSLHPEGVEQVILGEEGVAEAAREGLAVADLSTAPPELAVRLSDALRRRGAGMLDAPVSGADIGATNGELTVFVGGDYETYRRCLPVLQCVGRTVTYLGKSGNGQIAKRINQMMQAFSELAIFEGLLLAEKAGLDLKAFARAASGGCAQTWRLEELVDRVWNHGEKRYRMRIRPSRTGHALEMAKSAGVRLAGAEAAHQVFSERGWEVVIDFS